jgi:very-short-patch-repair endonuclease
MYRDQQQRDFARELRNQPTDAEKRLWHFLRAGKLGLQIPPPGRYRRVHCRFRFAFHRLIVELDGPQHVEEKGKERDARRTGWLNSRGFRVIRFRNQALDEDIWGVVEEIKGALRECASQPPSPALPSEGEGAGRGASATSRRKVANERVVRGKT